MPNWLKTLVVLTLLCAMVPAIQAESIATAGRQITAGIIVAAALVAVVIVVVLVHHGNRHASVTGCVSAGTRGPRLASERDHRVYLLTGDARGIKPGERLTVEGKRERSGGGWVLEVNRLKQDLGACRP